MRPPYAIVVGAGIAGAAAAYQLHQLGWNVDVLEAEAEVGGNLRSAKINHVNYEPHGPHVFHTNDYDVWRLVEDHCPLSDYRHHVKATLPDGRLVEWPLRFYELRNLPEWPVICDELSGLHEPIADNFEDYAVQLMGPTLYEWFCEGYTRKQWGVEPRQLSASFAPKRLVIRRDSDPGMFRDRRQGYPKSGRWQDLVESLLKYASVYTGKQIRLNDLDGADGYVITAPLDDFLGADQLPWRGVHTRFTHFPAERAASVRLDAPVVNDSRMIVPWTRMIETRQMVLPEHPAVIHGTVIGYEYPGADGVKHYPLDDVAGLNRARHQELVRQLRDVNPRAVLAGRLANYVYIDIDQAIRQGLNAARQLDGKNKKRE